MKDTIIKGDGTSRKLKAPASMPESFAAWREQLLAGTATVDLALNEAGCEVVGTPISKANLLADAVKSALGLTGADPTVSEALGALSDGERFSFRIGDVKQTARATLGEKWALCNGDVVYEADVPEFYAARWASAGAYDGYIPSREDTLQEFPDEEQYGSTRKSVVDETTGDRYLLTYKERTFYLFKKTKSATSWLALKNATMPSDLALDCIIAAVPHFVLYQNALVIAFTAENQTSGYNSGNMWLLCYSLLLDEMTFIYGLSPNLTASYTTHSVGKITTDDYGVLFHHTDKNGTYLFAFKIDGNGTVSFYKRIVGSNRLYAYNYPLIYDPRSGKYIGTSLTSNDTLVVVWTDIIASLAANAISGGGTIGSSIYNLTSVYENSPIRYIEEDGTCFVFYTYYGSSKYYNRVMPILYVNGSYSLGTTWEYTSSGMLCVVDLFKKGGKYILLDNIRVYVLPSFDSDTFANLDQYEISYGSTARFISSDAMKPLSRYVEFVDGVPYLTLTTAYLTVNGKKTYPEFVMLGYTLPTITTSKTNTFIKIKE